MFSIVSEAKVWLADDQEVDVKKCGGSRIFDVAAQCWLKL